MAVSLPELLSKQEQRLLCGVINAIFCRDAVLLTYQRQGLVRLRVDCYGMTADPAILSAVDLGILVPTLGYYT